MRKVIQHLDQHNWRALEYFRMLDKRAQLQLDKRTIATDIMVSSFLINRVDLSFSFDQKSGMQLEHEDIRNIHHRLTKNKSQPLTYKLHDECLDLLILSLSLFRRHLNTLIKEQRLRDRSLKIREEKQTQHKKQRNHRILQTVTHHFPEIEIVTRRQKHRQAITDLAKPRAASVRQKL